SRVHRGATAADAASDVACPEGRTGGAWGQGLAQCDLAVPAARGTTLQKKHCSPLSRRALTSPAGDSAGDRGKPASIPAAWSSSTRLGSRPAWPRCVDDQGMNLAADKVDAGQQAHRAVAFIFKLTCEGGVHAGLGRQIRSGGCDRLDARLLVV